MEDQLESARERLCEERPAWEDRLYAVEALGSLREPRAVGPLLAIFQDQGAT